MKNLITILVIALMSVVATAQSPVGLKGINLGEPLPEGLGIPTQGKTFSWQYTTTLAGVPGVILVGLTKDKIVYRMVFMPEIPGGAIGRAGTIDTETLIKGVINKFGLTDKKYYPSKYNKDSYYYLQDLDGVDYFINVETNNYMPLAHELAISISDIALKEQVNKDKQASANNDF